MTFLFILCLLWKPPVLYNSQIHTVTRLWLTLFPSMIVNLWTNLICLDYSTPCYKYTFMELFNVSCITWQFVVQFLSFSFRFVWHFSFKQNEKYFPLKLESNGILEFGNSFIYFVHYYLCLRVCVCVCCLLIAPFLMDISLSRILYHCSFTSITFFSFSMITMWKSAFHSLHIVESNVHFLLIKYIQTHSVKAHCAST